MNNEKLFKVLLAPHVTEKSAHGSSELRRKYIFKVLKEATKIDIKKAIKQFFGVNVESVSVLNVKGKKTSFRRIVGRHKHWKKAYVTLSAGEEIDMSEKA